jgi:organic hydroperoxide reductase OsmC/OhrA
MSEHHAEIVWGRDGEAFVDNRYHRVHEWRFDGGAVVRGSASPSVVPAPLSDPSAVDPEEAFVAALASCHMLWFLSIAAKRGIIVNRYEDAPVGFLGKLESGHHAITRVVLRPAVALSTQSEAQSAELDALHEEAHRQCFLANAVKCELRVEPRPTTSEPV